MNTTFAVCLTRALPVVVALALAACSTAPPVPPRSEPGTATDIAGRLSPDQAQDVTIYALNLVGTPYRYGGNTPDAGFDCSGLIGHVYKTRGGVLMPRTVARLLDAGQSIPADHLRSGDLVIFKQRGEATHAGIYVGADRFVHAPSTGGEVRLDSLRSKYWAAQQVAFRRP